MGSKTANGDIQFSEVSKVESTPMLIRHEWMKKFMVRDHRGGGDRLLEDRLRRELTLREENVWSNLVYRVKYSAQINSGRHATMDINESFTSYETAVGFLLTLAEKYAPQEVIDEIRALPGTR